MPDSTPYDPLIQALRNLPPAPHALSRERLLFEAGRASARPRFEWLWKTTTAVLACSTLVLTGFAVDPPHAPRGVEIVRQFAPAPVVADRPVDGERDAVAVEVPAVGEEMLIAVHIRREILEGGIDSMPEDRRADDLPGPQRERGIADLTDGLPLDGVFAFPVPRDIRK